MLIYLLHVHEPDEKRKKTQNGEEDQADTSSSNNVSEAAMISLFLATNRHNKLQEIWFKFPFNLTVKRTMTMAFLTG